jgi:phosphoribosylaminoimidazolecarboxamide formyltransferase/IMP cyclohydrolase
VQAVEKTKALDLIYMALQWQVMLFFLFQIVYNWQKKLALQHTTRWIIKDQLSIDYCNENKLAMVFTGTRHFKH